MKYSLTKEPIKTVEELTAFNTKSVSRANIRYNLKESDVQGVATSFWLEESNGGWHPCFIDLAPELGEKVRAIWTMKPYYRGSDRMVPYGAMTLTGILKRLGVKDAGKQIKAAKDARQAASAVNARNYSRRQIREAAQALAKAIIESHETGLEIPTDLNALNIALTDLEGIKDE